MCGGLTCLKPSDKLIFGSGGPAGGYCTMPCTAQTVTACTGIGGACVNLALNTTDPPAAYCMLPCNFGTMETKCQSRSDVACTIINQMTMQAVCLPTCSQNDQCPAGRQCDPDLAVCVDTPTGGDPLGVHCAADPDAAATCAGTCIALGSGTTVTASFCSRRCVNGVLQGCDWVDQGVSLAGARHGVCGLSQSSASGDLGFCIELCDTLADCHDTVDPGAFCDMMFANVIGHGICNFGGATDAGTRDAVAPRDARADGRD
jgi:hypothetical protein